MNETEAKNRIKTLDRELENFDRTYEEGRWLKNQGLLTTSHQSQLEGQRAQILLNQDIQAIVNEFINQTRDGEFQRVLVVLDRLIKYALVESNQSVYEIRSRIEQAIGNYPIFISGKKATRNEVRQILRFEKDAKLRLEASHSYDDLSRTVETDVRALVVQRNSIAQELGYKHFGELGLILQGLNHTQLTSWFNAILQATGPVYKTYLNQSAEKLHQDHLGPQDLFYSFCQYSTLPDHYFPKNKLTDAIFWLGNQIRISDALGRVRIDYADIPFQGICVTIHVPDDIRILIDPADGRLDYVTFFHEVGHAMHSSYIKQPYHLFRDEPGPFCEGMAQTMARFVDDPGMLSDYTKLPDDLRKLNKQFWGTYTMFHMRELITQAEFEWQMYASPEFDHLDSYRSKQHDYLQVSSSDTLAWASNMYWASYPFYVQNYLVAEMIASQTHSALYKKYGRAIQPESGEWLEQNYWNLGGSVEWSEKILHATGDELTPDQLIQELIHGYPQG